MALGLSDGRAVTQFAPASRSFECHVPPLVSLFVHLHYPLQRGQRERRRRRLRRRHFAFVAHVTK